MVPLKENTHFVTPLEKMAQDVKPGDLVRVFLNYSDYVGYRWDLSKANVGTQLMLPEDSDIILAALNPIGYTRFPGDSIVMDEEPSRGTIIVPRKEGGGHYSMPGIVRNRRYLNGPAFLQKIQFVGINLRTEMMGNEHAKGYEILERAESGSEED